MDFAVPTMPIKKRYRWLETPEESTAKILRHAPCFREHNITTL